MNITVFAADANCDRWADAPHRPSSTLWWRLPPSVAVIVSAYHRQLFTGFDDVGSHP
jgi:hypothetical protein